LPGTTEPSGPAITAQVRAHLAPCGLDLVQPFRVAWYQEACPTHPLPDLGDPGHLGLLIGNTRALWPRFLAARAAEPALAADPHPLDRFVERSLRAGLAPVPVAWEVRFAPEPPPRRVAMQRLAEISGLAALSPAHLSVHPEYGPWIALRAAVVLAVAGPEQRPPAPALACDCDHGCLPRLREALEAGVPASQADVRDHWRRWLAVRDGCPLGRDHRYSDQQIRYHYAGDLTLDPADRG